MQALEIIVFGKTDIENVIGKMSGKDIDKPAFAAIAIDKSGTVLKYNSAEVGIAGCDPAPVIGKTFLRDVAPCTAKPAFKGRRRSKGEQFEYHVRVRIRPSNASDQGQSSHETLHHRHLVLGRCETHLIGRRRDGA